MKLYELLNVIITDYMIGVSKGPEFIEEFGSCDTQKRTKYRNAVVTGLHVLNEDMLAINIDIAEDNIKEGLSRDDVKNANDFREAIIGVANYMAFARKEVVAFTDSINVEWGLKGACNYEGIKQVIPTVSLIDRTNY